MSINRRLNKEDTVYIYNRILLSNKKNEIMPFAATWMDLEIIIVKKGSQKETDKWTRNMSTYTNTHTMEYYSARKG